MVGGLLAEAASFFYSLRYVKNYPVKIIPFEALTLTG